MSFEDGVEYASHLGRGFGRAVWSSNTHMIGGSLAVKGMADDGSGQYDKSEWITSQTLLRTSDALTTDIVTIPWIGVSEVIQIKAYIIGTIIDSAAFTYHAEIIGCYTINDASVITEVGSPILNASSANFTTQPDVEMSADASGVYVSVTGTGTDTIQWLCSYSYHRLINIV